MPEEGALACLRCCDGTEAGPNRTVCDICDAGHVSNGSLCTSCAIGFFTRGGSTVCEACAQGMQSNEFRTDCIDVDECATPVCVDGLPGGHTWLSNVAKRTLQRLQRCNVERRRCGGSEVGKCRWGNEPPVH